MLSLLGAIVAIGLLIVAHEGGHYVVARLCKMRVDRFSVGFGPGILKWKRGDTEFQIAPIPFGGFVQIAGMNIAEEVERDDVFAYPNRPAWQRFLTIFAGPATNYLFAVVLAFGLYQTAGVETGTDFYEVAGTSEGGGAFGKLQAGDRIIRVDGNPVYISYAFQPGPTLQDAIQRSKGTPVTITVERGGQELDFSVTPKIDEEAVKANEPPYRIGVSLNASSERVRVGVALAAKAAIIYPGAATKQIVQGLSDIIRGRAKGEVRGPVGIAEVVQQQFAFGWVRVIELLMMLNVYLGLFNLLPLPALDGGRLAFLGYEMATRRRPNPRIEATVHMVGIMCLIVIFVLVTFKDISRLL